MCISDKNILFVINLRATQTNKNANIIYLMPRKVDVHAFTEIIISDVLVQHADDGSPLVV